MVRAKKAVPKAKSASSKAKTGFISWDELAERSLSKEEVDGARQWAAQEMAQMNLRAIREMAGETQVSLAAKAHTTQGELSRIENGKNPRIETLRKYVESLGGELEVVARIGNKSVRLVGL